MSAPRISSLSLDALPAFVELLEEAATWLWRRGIRQWEPGSLRPQLSALRGLAGEGCLLGAEQRDQLVGGCVLTARAGSIWADRPGTAMVLHKLVVARSASGQGLGRRLLRAAEAWAWERGASRLRLDCWDGNEVLKAWYRRHGYLSLDSAVEHGYRVRLFEKSLQPEPRGWRLRPTRPADLDFVIGLETSPDYTPYIGHWSREEHEQSLEHPDRSHHILTGIGEEEPHGFAIGFDLRSSGHGIYLKRFAVSPTDRGLGKIGLDLFVTRALVDLRATHVWLVVRQGNDRARQLYEGAGFHEIARGWPRRGHVLGLWPGGDSGRLAPG